MRAIVRRARWRMSALSVVTLMAAVVSADSSRQPPPLGQDDLIRYWMAAGKVVSGDAVEFSKTRKELDHEVRASAFVAEMLYKKPTAPRLTNDGFSKRVLPEHLLHMLWDVVAKPTRVLLEGPTGNLPEWGNGSKTFIISIPHRVEQHLTEHFGPILEEWVEQKLEFSNHYGIRCYSNGSTLGYHIDNVHQVVSIIVPVLLNATGTWPLHIETHTKGEPKVVTIDPGEVLLYESYRLPHWRPHALNGFCCNLFLHWKLPHSKWDVETMEQYERRIDKIAMRLADGEASGSDSGGNEEREEL